MNVLKNFDIDKITFSRPDKISKNVTIFNVKYANNQKFVIQTPRLLIPNKPMYYENNNYKSCSLKLQSYNCDFDKTTKNFFSKLQKIDKFVQSKADVLWTKAGLSKNKKRFIPTLYSKIKNPYFYCNIQMYNKNPIINVYDYAKNEQSIDYIIPYSKTYSILILDNIWLKSRKIGLNWTILQLKIYLPVHKIDRCLIVEESELELEKNDNSNNNNLIVSEHPDYKPFFNMKRFGVPRHIIEIKMKQKGFKPEYLDNPNQNLEKPKNKAIDKMIKSNLNLNHILKNNLSNVSLKKIDIKNKLPNKKNISFIDKTLKRPTLNEILSMKERLKSIN
uniref:Uncharacterized protein n=1 Tax=viral metagenome TaxID=1070528 RepID=A0A6C0IW68_9ZZZZ